MNLHGPVFMIVFDDRDVPPEVFGGEQAEQGARARFEQVLTNWNANLFQRIDDGRRPLDKPFPVLIGGPSDPRCPKFIRWNSLNEEWAQRNHDQSLKRLAERGGLSPCEALANIERRPWHRMNWELALAKILPYSYSGGTVDG